MITSKLSSKAQTTLPRAVRAALGIGNGDELAYEIRGATVVITKARRAQDDPFTLFDEWSSDADRKAYDGL